MMERILFVMTGTDHWTLSDVTRHPTGYWAEEFLTPYRIFEADGHEIDVATPGGTPPVVDQASLSAEANGGEDEARRVAADLEQLPVLRSPKVLGEVALGDYDAVFYPGGHGPMEDLALDEDSGRLIVKALVTATPLGVVCHGPAAMLAAKREDGGWAFKGYRMTAFTNTEEKQAGLADRAPWLLQDRLEAEGAEFEEGEAWRANIVVDRTLYTGQNPASSGPLAEALRAALG
jgi:putative intracellular protease/amidase